MTLKGGFPDPYVHGSINQRVSFLYLPAVHAGDVHGPPSGPDEPTLHVHKVKAELPAGELEYVGQVEQVASNVAPVTAEYRPDGQLRHKAVPVPTLYLPATHCVQVPPPSGPEEPALQVQAVMAELPAGELEWVGQVEQESSDVAPTVTEYVPATQSVHTAVPDTALYFPTRQFTHVPPFGPEYPFLHTQTALPIKLSE